MHIEPTQIELSLYTFQQFISRLLYLNLYLQKPAFLFFLFLSGVLTSLNPCMISMLPISLSYVSISNVNNKKTHYLSFLLGVLSSVFICLLFFTILSYKYHNLFMSLPLLSSLITVLLSLFLLKILRFDIVTNQSCLSSKLIFNSYVKNYLLGLSLGINTSTCSIPILLTLLFVLSYSCNYVLISVYILVYLLGYLFILLIMGFLIIQLRFIQNTKFMLITSISIRSSGCIALSFGILRILENIFL